MLDTGCLGRVPRHEDQRDRRPRFSTRSVRLEQRLVLLLVQAAADDHDVACPVAERATQHLCLITIRRGSRQVVLHVARHAQALHVDAERAQPARVLLGLDGDEVEHPQNTPDQPGACMHAVRLRRHLAVDQHHGCSPPPRTGDEVRPELRLGHDQELGIEVLEAAPHDE